MEERKAIIKNEIKYWQKNRLLPDVYCTFLLRLYDRDESVPEKRRTRLTSKSMAMILASIVMTALTFLVIYFTQFSTVMQIGLASLLFLLFSSGLVYSLKANKATVSYFVCGAAVIQFYWITLVLHTVIEGSQFALTMSVIITCVVWIWAGRWFRLTYLWIAGVSGFVMLFLFFSLL
ncbi:hypothetical protein [Alteribacter aurantiacus]|uniref:hypothetical protein n=1 Tax=Alteribacter aurantiacus TaxID=254410 RepID=UPI00047B6EDE|nr:hypothetical protein [Alteribacter aurantiacus]